MADSTTTPAPAHQVPASGADAVAAPCRRLAAGTATPSAAAPAEAPQARRRPGPDVAAGGTYLAAALFITGRLWANVPDRVTERWAGDRVQAEWHLALAARVLTHLENPFFTARMNAPLGVNTMANTSMLGLGAPATPITLILGPAAAFDVLIVCGLAGTAFAWYYVLSRHLVSSRAAAWTGGVVCGFAPSVTAHASWHPNLVAQFLVPFIAWRVVRLREAGRSLRNGLPLGALITYQAFINEEMLFFTALACGLFVLAYATARRADARAVLRPFLSGLCVAALTAGLLLAYPLRWQFFGPGSYHGIEEGMSTFRIDVLGYTSFASNSVARQLTVMGPQPAPESEDNAYFGWPLVLFTLALAGWLWREAAIRAAAITAATFALLSFGPELIVAGRRTGVPGPSALFDHLPLFDCALPIRYGQVTTPLVGLVLALGYDRSRQVRLPAEPPPWRRRLLLSGLAATVLVPAAPLPLRAVDRPATPEFVTQGTWRQYVGRDESVLVVPTPTFEFPESMWWSAQTGLDLRLSHGYFLGPGPGGRAQMGSPPRSTDQLLKVALLTGQAPQVSDDDRARARADFAYWRTAIVVLRPGPLVPAACQRTVDALAGPGRFIDGVWVWDVRQLR